MVLTAIHSGYLLKGTSLGRTEMYSVVGPEDAPDWKTSWGYSDSFCMQKEVATQMDPRQNGRTDWKD